MNFETALVIICSVVCLACFIGYRIANENVYMKYKDHRCGK